MDGRHREVPALGSRALRGLRRQHHHRQHKVTGGARVQAYTCSYHWKRGSEVCPVKLREPRDIVRGS